MSYKIPILYFYVDGFGIKKATKFHMPFREETENYLEHLNFTIRRIINRILNHPRLIEIKTFIKTKVYRIINFKGENFFKNT